MITKEEKQLVRYAIRHRWLDAEEGEDILFLREKFGKKFSIEELIRKRQYLTDAEIRELIENSSREFNRRRQRTGIFRLRALTQEPEPTESEPAPKPQPEVKPEKVSSSSNVARSPKRRALRRLDGASQQKQKRISEPRVPTPTDIHQTNTAPTSTVTEEEAFQSPERTVVDDSYLAELEQLRSEFAPETRDDSSLKVPHEIPPMSSSVEYLLDPAASEAPSKHSLPAPSVEYVLDSENAEDSVEKTVVGVPVLDPDFFSDGVSVSQSVETKEIVPQESLAENQTVALVPEEVQSLRAFREAYKRQASDVSKKPTQEIAARAPVAPSTVGRSIPVAPSLHNREHEHYSAPSVQPTPRKKSTREAPALHSKASLHEALQAAVRSPDELAEGDEFAGFTIVRCVARGKMSTVYLAQRKSEPSMYAIRVLTRTAQADHTYAKRFLEQSNKMRNFEAPHLVRIFHVGTQDSHHFSIAQFVDGWSLEEQLTTKGPLEPLEALRVANAVVQALKALAQKGYCHGDIKPSNILINKAGEIFLKDVGLAEDLAVADLKAAGATHSVSGTAEYMAPELLKGQPAAFQSDAYALGMTLVKLLSGHALFQGGQIADVLRQSLLETRPPVATILSRATADLHQLIDRLIQYHPQQRFSRVKQLDETVQALLRQEARNNQKRPATQVRADNLRSRKITSEAALAGGTGVLLFVGVGGLLNFIISKPVSRMSLNSALTSTAAISLLIAMSLFVGLSLIRRGQIALPSASTFFLRTKDISGAIGGACLTISMLIASPSALRLLAGALGLLTWLTLVYGVAVRRDIARVRFGGSSSRTLAILGDARLRPWRRIHALMLCTVVSVSILNFAVARYFQAKIG